MSDTSVTNLASTNFRVRSQVFGIRGTDRLQHLYAVGKTGTGKSTLIETLASQDVEQGNGFVLLDPHGESARAIGYKVRQLGRTDVIDFNASDALQLLAFNPLMDIRTEDRPRAATGLLDAFKKLWSDSWGPRLEHILRNSLFVLLDQPSATLADILRLLSDPTYRREALTHVENLQVREFWLKEYSAYPDRFRTEAIAPIQNKVGAFLANPILHRILCQPRNDINIRQIMDEGKVLIVNLAKGRIGEDASALLGSLLIAMIGSEALGRADIPEHERRDFFVYIDEFQTFTTLSLANMLAELRKYHVGLVLANQYLAQLDPAIQEAVLGNAGTLISFRVGVSDAEILAKEFYPTFSVNDLINLPNHHMYLKLMIDGQVSKPFSAVTLPPKAA